MSVVLTKNEKLNLTKKVEGLKTVIVGLGWDAAKKGLFGRTHDIDCDASAIILDKNGKYKSVVYFNNRSYGHNYVYHHGDNLTGAGAGDDEQITVKLEEMPEDVGRVIFVVNIYNCTSRNQHFGMIKNAFIRLVDKSTNKEICRYNLSENYDKKTAMIFAEVYKENNEWKFNAVGEGTNDRSISEMTSRYK